MGYKLGVMSFEEESVLQSLDLFLGSISYTV